ncbi:OsmC family peroxiredoxin [Candidatus Thorarchaeota archaeon]|nr:MAG: OsmC family peroxiredoxin [Candidatus Thorarchaeota archaeon]
MTEEHRYSVKSRWVEDRIVTMEIEGKTMLKSAPPRDFWEDCPDETYSPEDLFLASAVTCYSVSIPGVAKRFHADFDDFEVTGKGHLAKGEHGWEFEEITIDAKITVSSESDEKKMKKVAERAHTYCVVANSMSCPVKLKYKILRTDT